MLANVFGDIILWMSSLESPFVFELRRDESDKAEEEQAGDEFSRWKNESIKFRPFEELAELLLTELIGLMFERRGLFAF